MDFLLSNIFFGVIHGGLIALAGVGLSLQYRIVNFINFAYGDFMTAGAFAAYVLSQFGLPLPMAVAGAVLFVALLGVAVNQVVFRPLTRAGAMPLLVSSIGVAFVLRYLIRAVWGPDPRRYAVPIQRAFHWGPLWVTPLELQLLGLSLLGMVGVHLLLRHTKLGKAMRACADSLDLAQVSGISTDRVIGHTWLLTSALAALSGVMFGLAMQFEPRMGFDLLLPIFAAIILGGIGNPYGAVLGALIIGISSELTAAYWSSGYRNAVAFLVIGLLFFLRPQGLWGNRG
ncbi:MAG: branched-chain amino acid ABC transporter permease [Nitrospinota bacterium]|nr:MAG: branched-chain amino acid ABC transporter permease [Nitrospinota bacterium]